MEEEQTEDQKSKAAAAREARRKRILEQSNKRMTALTGRVHDEEIFKNVDKIVTTNGSIYPDPELERDVYEGPPPLRVGVAGSQESDIMEMIRLMQGAAPNDSNPPLQQQQQQQKPETPFSRFIKSSLPITAIAIITYSLFIFQLHHLIGNAVFSIFIAWEILVFTLTAFLYPEASSLSGILNFLPLFFPRLNPKVLQIALKLFMFFNKAFRDLAIFLFTFVMFHITYSFFVSGESLSRILDKDMNNVLTS